MFKSFGSKNNHSGKAGFGIVAVVLIAVLLTLNPSIVFAFFNTHQSATLVLGQSDFSNNEPYTNQTQLNGPGDMAFDSSGNLWVVDIFNNRVLEFSPPFSDDELASVVLGQPGFYSNLPALNLTATPYGLYYPAGIAIDPAGNVWVSDYNNNRVLEYAKGSGFTNGEPASIVLGQNNFTTNNGGTSSTTMWNPCGLAFDSSGNLWVADNGNNRVLEFLAPLYTGEAASTVLGHTSFTDGSANRGTQNGFYNNCAIAIDSSGDVWVTDNGDNRILEFVKGAGGFVNGQAASLVLGQPNFTDYASRTTSSGMYDPNGITFDQSGNLWVADFGNSRMLEFPFPFTTGETASVVLGQSNFASSIAALGPSGLNSPVDAAVDATGNLWVSDTYNNRILEYQEQNCSVNNVLFCGVLHLPKANCPPICTIPQGNYEELTVSINSPDISSLSLTVTPPQQEGGPASIISTTRSASSTLTISSSPLGTNQAECQNEVCGPFSVDLDLPGIWSLAFTGTTVSGLMETLTYSMLVTPVPVLPDFAISSSMGSINLAPGATGKATIKLSSENGFADAISLSASFDAPSGPTLQLNPSVVSLSSGGKGAAKLVITTSDSTVGTYLLTVTGSGEATGISQSVTLLVNIQYKFGGFISPTPSQSFSIGSTIPVEFKLFDAKNKLDPSGVGSVYIDGVFQGQTGFSGSSYLFDLNTAGLVVGPHTIVVRLNDGSWYSVIVNLT